MGDQAAFLSAGDYHHHIGLNTWESAGGPPPPPGTTGLFHSAFLYPDRPALARAVALAAVVLRERIHGSQGVGLLLCGVAVGLVASA